MEASAVVPASVNEDAFSAVFESEVSPAVATLAPSVKALCPTRLKVPNPALANCAVSRNAATPTSDVAIAAAFIIFLLASRVCVAVVVMADERACSVSKEPWTVSSPEFTAVEKIVPTLLAALYAPVATLDAAVLAVAKKLPPRVRTRFLRRHVFISIWADIKIDLGRNTALLKMSPSLIEIAHVLLHLRDDIDAANQLVALKDKPMRFFRKCRK